MAKNKAAPHSFVKEGIYYFCRRVPNDLRHHYTSTKISYSLRTRSVTVAASRAQPRETVRRWEEDRSGSPADPLCSSRWLPLSYQRRPPR
ncbi:MAG: DUF6538 domain-containing protein, partial [Tabrizicola flagellatus]|uniref:DUF6538 domain-containing protein n=1 Tax=Tabrizicola flagellatus TaxID=2593021 RepID=UPI0039197F20